MNKNMRKMYTEEEIAKIGGGKKLYHHYYYNDSESKYVDFISTKKDKLLLTDFFTGSGTLILTAYMYNEDSLDSNLYVIYFGDSSDTHLEGNGIVNRNGLQLNYESITYSDLTKSQINEL